LVEDQGSFKKTAQVIVVAEAENSTLKKVLAEIEGVIFNV